MELPWQDQAFHFRPELVTLTGESLFKLDPELLEELASPRWQSPGGARRLDHLLDLIFGAKHQSFAYAGGHSTVAAETWRLKRGDCLSLTVLTYAVARAMNMAPIMQEVEVSALYDRRGNLDFVNQHVNVLFRNARWNFYDTLGAAHDIVVDFEPEYGSSKPGRQLSEAAILARFYNNLGVEHLAAGRNDLAYAHFKAAITADPHYAASYSNLAVLYRNGANDRDAETLLKYAVALSDPPDVALRSMRQLLLDQGRTAEASQYGKRLEALRDRDPYHWVGQGLQRLQDGQYRQAAVDLEHALTLANGFPELHRYLAVAYWRLGNPARANEQLAILESLDDRDPSVSALRSKFGRNPSR